MRFLLIHSPLVPSETWMTLAPSLEQAGADSITVTLDNKPARNQKLYEHHIAQIESAVSAHPAEKLVATAHSGAGNLLALLDPARFDAHIFLDAIFPLAESARFALFDEAEVVESWRRTASRHRGMIPCAMLARFADQIAEEGVRRAFAAGILDVPIGLYEESIPVHPDWPVSKGGLYLQWSSSYRADAGRARRAGFEVRVEPASHLQMLNEPAALARQMIDFVRDLQR